MVHSEPIRLRVHPKYKTRYRVTHWCEYERGLVQRGVDAAGEIVAQILTDSNVDDGTVGVAIMDDLRDCIRSVTADAAYDTRPMHDAAESEGAEIIVTRSLKVSTKRRGRGTAARDRAIKRVNGLERRRWKKESGYHRHARVENTFFRARRSSASGFERASKAPRERRLSSRPRC